MKRRCVVLSVSVIVPFWSSLCVGQQSISFARDNAVWRTGLLKSEAPAYPFLAKHYRCQGRGLFRVTVNPATGVPAQVVTLKSTGFGILDNSAIWALRAWRWVPGTRKQFDIPITFELSPNYPKHPAGTSALPRSPR
jgi:TonB family protein